MMAFQPVKHGPIVPDNIQRRAKTVAYWVLGSNSRFELHFLIHPHPVRFTASNRFIRVMAAMGLALEVVLPARRDT